MTCYAFPFEVMRNLELTDAALPEDSAPVCKSRTSCFMSTPVTKCMCERVCVNLRPFLEVLFGRFFRLATPDET
jgi:hypothetical protein